MKTSNVKPENLSSNQSRLWDDVTSSPHPLNAISCRSGYSEQSIRNWINGVFEPTDNVFNNVTEAIKALADEPPTSINWKLKKPELVELKGLGLSNRQIAKRMNTSKIAIERATKRILKVAA